MKKGTLIKPITIKGRLKLLSVNRVSSLKRRMQSKCVVQDDNLFSIQDGSFLRTHTKTRDPTYDEHVTQATNGRQAKTRILLSIKQVVSDNRKTHKGTETKNTEIRFHTKL